MGPTSCEVSWKKPLTGVYKINVDGATANDGRCSSIRMSIRDSRGEAIAGLCRVLPDNFFVVETEALVVEVGILLTKEMDLQQIIIKSNSLSVVSSIFQGS